jgi:nuclear protein localization family protein 4
LSLCGWCRDGLERIQVDENGTLGSLKLAIQQKLGVPLEDMLLSKNPQLVRCAPRRGTAGGRDSLEPPAVP